MIVLPICGEVLLIEQESLRHPRELCQTVETARANSSCGPWFLQCMSIEFNQERHLVDLDSFMAGGRFSHAQHHQLACGSNQARTTRRGPWRFQRMQSQTNRERHLVALGFSPKKTLALLWLNHTMMYDTIYWCSQE